MSWRSAKQQYVTESTYEDEYVAAPKALKEVVWIRDFIIELGFLPVVDALIPLQFDIEGAVSQSKELKKPSKMKHVNRKYHIIRKFIQKKQIVVNDIRIYKQGLKCRCRCRYLASQACQYTARRPARVGTPDMQRACL